MDLQKEEINNYDNVDLNNELHKFTSIEYFNEAQIDLLINKGVNKIQSNKEHRIPFEEILLGPLPVSQEENLRILKKYSSNINKIFFYNTHLKNILYENQHSHIKNLFDANIINKENIGSHINKMMDIFHDNSSITYEDQKKIFENLIYLLDLYKEKYDFLDDIYNISITNSLALLNGFTQLSIFLLNNDVKLDDKTINACKKIPKNNDSDTIDYIIKNIHPENLNRSDIIKSFLLLDKKFLKQTNSTINLKLFNQNNLKQSLKDIPFLISLVNDDYNYYSKIIIKTLTSQEDRKYLLIISPFLMTENFINIKNNLDSVIYLSKKELLEYDNSIKQIMIIMSMEDPELLNNYINTKLFKYTNIHNPIHFCHDNNEYQFNHFELLHKHYNFGSSLEAIFRLCDNIDTILKIIEHNNNNINNPEIIPDVEEKKSRLYLHATTKEKIEILDNKLIKSKKHPNGVIVKNITFKDDIFGKNPLFELFNFSVYQKNTIYDTFVADYWLKEKYHLFNNKENPSDFKKLLINDYKNHTSNTIGILSIPSLSQCITNEHVYNNIDDFYLKEKVEKSFNSEEKFSKILDAILYTSIQNERSSLMKITPINNLKTNYKKNRL